jgi:hypothetical protein
MRTAENRVESELSPAGTLPTAEKNFDVSAPGEFRHPDPLIKSQLLFL